MEIVKFQDNPQDSVQDVDLMFSEENIVVIISWDKTL